MATPGSVKWRQDEIIVFYEVYKITVEFYDVIRFGKIWQEK